MHVCWMNERHMATGNSVSAVRIPENVNSPRNWPDSPVSPWCLRLNSNPVCDPRYRTRLHGQSCVLGAWVVCKTPANPFRKLCALVFHLRHCSRPQEEVSSFRVTSKPHYVHTHTYAHPSPWLTLWKVHLRGPSFHLTSVQIKVISLRANHLLLEIIPYDGFFVNALLNSNKHIEMYTCKRLTQQVSYKLNILM